MELELEFLEGIGKQVKVRNKNGDKIPFNASVHAEKYATKIRTRQKLATAFTNKAK